MRHCPGIKELIYYAAHHKFTFTIYDLVPSRSSYAREFKASGTLECNEGLDFYPEVTPGRALFVTVNRAKRRSWLFWLPFCLVNINNHVSLFFQKFSTYRPSHFDCEFGWISGVGDNLRGDCLPETKNENEQWKLWLIINWNLVSCQYLRLVIKINRKIGKQLY